MRFLTRTLWFATLTASMLVAACKPVDLQSAQLQQADSNAGVATFGTPASFLPLQLMSQGNMVLLAPKVQVIGFGQSERAADVQRYMASWANSTAWSEATAEYGIGAMSIAPLTLSAFTWPSVVYDTDIFTDGSMPSDVESFLAGLFDTNGSIPADTHTLAIVVMPQNVKVAITGSSASSACDQGIYSWHTAMLLPLSKQILPYVVVPACAAKNNLNDADSVAVAVSHSVINAVTNPANFGLGRVADAQAAWRLLSGSTEAASLCVSSLYGSPQLVTRPAGVTQAVHRSWSNARSLAGQSPCVPALDDEVYYSISPTNLRTVAATLDGGAIVAAVPGITLAPGARTSVNLALFSSAADGQDFNISATEVNGAAAGGDLTLTLNTNQGRSGQTATLSVVMSNQATASQYVVRLTANKDTQYYSQYFLVRKASAL